MLKDRSGFTAYVDAIAFMAIILMALSVISMQFGMDEENGPNASEAMDAISAAKVRPSDVSDLDDGAVVFLTDVLAYSLANGDGKPLEYLEEFLDLHCRGHPYRMELSYGDENSSIGEEDVKVYSGAESSFPVSLGGTLSASLRIGL
jgi:hypothetical protein